MLQKEQFQKTAETSADLIGYKSADKITNVSWESTNELPSDEKQVDVKRATPKKRYISPEERQQIMEYQKIGIPLFVVFIG